MKTVFSVNLKTIQNALIECTPGYINEFIKPELSEAHFFSVQVDDTIDLPKSQCSVIVQHVNMNDVLVEQFLGFDDVSADRTTILNNSIQLMSEVFTAGVNVRILSCRAVRPRSKGVGCRRFSHTFDGLFSG